LKKIFWFINLISSKKIISRIFLLNFIGKEIKDFIVDESGICLKHKKNILPNTFSIKTINCKNSPSSTFGKTGLGNEQIYLAFSLMLIFSNPLIVLDKLDEKSIFMKIHQICLKGECQIQ
jgi:hypothetical protein